MHFRRSAAVVVAAAALFSAGCAKLDDRGKPQNVAVAVFDPSKSLIPLPNDLALGSIPNAAVAAGCPGAVLPDAKSQFLCGLKASGGFPNDQEVSISFAFQRQSVDDAGALHAEPAVLDTTTVTVLGAVPPAQATVAVFDVTSAPTVVPVVVEASHDASSGTLKLRKPVATDGSRRWIGGHKYAVFVRGGPSGVKTVGGGTIEPMPTMFVLRESILSGRSLTDPDNQSLLPGTAEQKAAAGAQLEQIRQGYRTLRPLFSQAFGGASFGEMVNMLTFTIAPYAGAVVEVDSTKGSAPLPIDLLRRPDVDPVLAGTILDNPAYGPARVGLVSLDGFSTTGSITAPFFSPPPVNGTIDVATITTNVFVYDLSTDPPTQLKEFKRELASGGVNAAKLASYVAQPTGSYVPAGKYTCPPTSGGCTTTLVLQPAVPVAAAGVFLPPLKSATKYAVVVTKGVKDVAGNALGRSTVARILLETTAPIDASIGVDAGLAALLQQIRTDLAPVWTAPGAPAKSSVAMAYVFRTQTVPDVSLRLAAAPYQREHAAGAALFVPAAVTTIAVAPTTSVAATFDVAFPAIDATDRSTGALNPNTSAWAPTVLHALVAAPDPSLIPSNCPAPANALKCAPLVVFGHGLGGSRGTMTAVMESLAARGFVVAAIDFPQHGARSWCFTNADCDDAGADGVCTPFPQAIGPTYQGDLDPSTGLPRPPGTCTTGVPKAAISAQTFISSNFFRTRDIMRQNVLDQSTLVLALARPPSAQWPFQPAAGADALKAKLLESGIVIDPGKIYWEGISLGGIAGVQVLASSPRFSRGVNSAGGATMVDIFTQASSWQARVVPLFTSLLKTQLEAIAPATPGRPFDRAYIDPVNGTSFDPPTAAAYGKTLLTVKWILDPGDAVNYASHVRSSPLLDLLRSTPAAPVLQPAKAMLSQVNIGDLTIPNDWNRELAALIGGDTVEYTSLSYSAGQMHSLLGLDPTVQSQAASYLTDPVTYAPGGPGAGAPLAPPAQNTVPPAP